MLEYYSVNTFFYWPGVFLFNSIIFLIWWLGLRKLLSSPDLAVSCFKYVFIYLLLTCNFSFPSLWLRQQCVLESLQYEVRVHWGPSILWSHTPFSSSRNIPFVFVLCCFCVVFAIVLYVSLYLSILPNFHGAAGSFLCLFVSLISLFFLFILFIQSWVVLIIFFTCLCFYKRSMEHFYLSCTK